nr:MAG TPA: hypothetical protein [Caudoviricetes sp.]
MRIPTFGAHNRDYLFSIASRFSIAIINLAYSCFSNSLIHQRVIIQSL